MALLLVLARASDMKLFDVGGALVRAGGLLRGSVEEKESLRWAYSFLEPSDLCSNGSPCATIGGARMATPPPVDELALILCEGTWLEGTVSLWTR